MNPGSPGASPVGVGRRGALKALGVSALALAGVGRASARAAFRADVLVLGAGLAGLAAARCLSAAGMRPLVLEARHRPGGRAYTRFDLPDRAEFGAVEVGGLLHPRAGAGASLRPRHSALCTGDFAGG